MFLLKAIQSRLLSFISTKFGMALVVACFFVCLNTTIGLLHALIPKPQSIGPTSSQSTSSFDSSSPLSSLFSLSSNDVVDDNIGAGYYYGGGDGNSYGYRSRRDDINGHDNDDNDNDNDILSTFHHLLTSPSSSSSSSSNDMTYPAIDIVYTWVNGSDLKLQADLAYWTALYEKEAEAKAISSDDAATTSSLNATSFNATAFALAAAALSREKTSPNRYRDNEELRYSLRSIQAFAPWVRKVFIVTNGQVPHWLNLDHPRLTVVSHADIFPNASHLPTFSSPAIESHLHRIPGLASKFIYFNDDVMFGARITPDDFYTLGSGGQKVFLSWNVPLCAPGCTDAWLGDLYCDKACDNLACSYDNGDCQHPNGTRTGAPGTNPGDSRYRNWDLSKSAKVEPTQSAKYCALGCPNSWLGDKVCDRACKNQECAYDGADCGVELIQANIMQLYLNRSRANASSSSTSSTSPSAPAPVEFRVPYDTRALYVNLSQYFPGNTHFTEASHDRPGLVRSAVVTQNARIVTMTLFEEKDVLDEDEQVEVAAVNANVTQNANATNDTNANSTSSTPAPSEYSLVENPPSYGDDDEFEADHPLAANSTSSNSSSAPALLAEHRIEVFISGTDIHGVMNLTFFILRPRYPTAEVANHTDIASSSVASTSGAIEPANEDHVQPTLVDSLPAPTLSSMSGAAASIPATSTIASSSTASHSTVEDSNGEDDGEDDGDDNDADDAAPRHVSPHVRVGGGRRLMRSINVLASSIRESKRLASASSAVYGMNDTATDAILQQLPHIHPYHPPPAIALAVNPASSEANSSIPSVTHGRPAPRPRAEATMLGSQLPASWRDMDVVVEGVPSSADMVRSGVKLRDDASSSMHSHSNDHANEHEHHESRGWDALDRALAERVRVHKAKELWTLAHDRARSAFMDEFAKQSSEKREAMFLEKRRRTDANQANGVNQRTTIIVSHDHDHNHAATTPIADRHANPSTHHPSPPSSPSAASAPAPRRPHPHAHVPRAMHEPVWPWDVSAATSASGARAAPDLLAQWAWEASAEVEARDAIEANMIPLQRTNEELNTNGTRSNQTHTRQNSSSIVPIQLGLVHNSSISAGYDSFVSSSRSSLLAVADLSVSSTTDVSITSRGGPRRELMDLYGDSLRFVHTLYTRTYGRATRKAPAHMPHMIDVAVESELQDRWPALFDATSSHKFRHGQDMQYSFSYFYYLMHRKRKFDMINIWNEFDRDRDGRLNEIEIRYMALWTSSPSKKLLPSHHDHTMSMLLNVTRIRDGYPYNYYHPSHPPTIDILALLHSGSLIDTIDDLWTALPEYPFEIVTAHDQIEFYMVPDNATIVQLRLDEIRLKRPKFICLNDDMGKDGKDAPEDTIRALRQFYDSYLPMPSPFEIQQHHARYEGAYQHIDEWRADKRISTWNVASWLPSTIRRWSSHSKRHISKTYIRITSLSLSFLLTSSILVLLSFTFMIVLALLIREEWPDAKQWIKREYRKRIRIHEV